MKNSNIRKILSLLLAALMLLSMFPVTSIAAQTDVVESINLLTKLINAIKALFEWIANLFK